MAEKIEEMKRTIEELQDQVRLLTSQLEESRRELKQKLFYDRIERRKERSNV